MNRITRFNNTFPSLLDELFSPASVFSTFGNPKQQSSSWPALDVSETDTEYMVQLDVPGLSQQDISIDYRDGMLSITGEVHRERTAANGNRYYQERHAGSFSRNLRLGRHVDVEAITAQLENGVLEIRIPKQEAYTPKAIPIQTPKALGMGE